MGNDLPKELVNKAQPMINRANMEASGARPSGDRIVIAGLVAKNCLFLGKDTAFDHIIKIIADEMKLSTGQRGIQHDYSFHHRPDRVNNTDSYGYGKFANAFGELTDAATQRARFETDMQEKQRIYGENYPKYHSWYSKSLINGNTWNLSLLITSLFSLKTPSSELTAFS